MARARPILTLTGSEAYGEYLDRLLIEARQHGHKIDTYAGIVEYALNRLGLEWGMTPPHRARPIGWNQFDDTSTQPSED